MMTAVMMLLGSLLLLVGGIMMIVNAFKVSMAWGLGVLFLWPVGLYFLVKNWQENKNPFFMQLAGLAILIVSFVMAPAVTP